ncbi:MAG: M20 family metallopeptidase [Pirellulales bacterium]|jgi:acetylornithine deacetylase/succinyl-diaminopimelate desuccinylase-like protein
MPSTLDVCTTLQQLVRLPSVNPMGKQVQGDIYYEHRVTDFLETQFREWGLSFERQAVFPQRENIIAMLPGAVDPMSGGKLLMLEVHQDTVPVDGMTIDPFAAELKDGRIYGRGSCDIKGGMAVYLTVLSRLMQLPADQRPSILLACSINEEHGFDGATHMAQSFSDQTSTVMPRKPDAVIVAEPTMLDVVVAHKGVIRWVCQTHGKATHSSDPSKGDNAIYTMGECVLHLKDYAENVLPTFPAYPQLGKPTLSVGTITGGISVNTVPDQCEIEIDYRMSPGGDPLAARDAVIEYLASKLSDATKVTHGPPTIISPGLSAAKNQALATQLINTANNQGHTSKAIGVPYGTDAPAFDLVDVPTVVFGPGSINQAHTKDEWVAVEHLEAAVEVVYEFCVGFGE